jgi:hypothetical protein
MHGHPGEGRRGSQGVVRTQVDLVKLEGNRATYRSHELQDDPLLEGVFVQVDRGRFQHMGRPGSLDVELHAVRLEPPEEGAREGGEDG